MLSSQQRQQIDSIIAKYKDAPFTQDTYKKIQDDLKSSGLSAIKLAAEDKINSFNSTEVFMNALYGDSTINDGTSFFDNSDEQANSDSYMNQILSKWKNISTTSPSK